MITIKATMVNDHNDEIAHSSIELTEIMIAELRLCALAMLHTRSNKPDMPIDNVMLNVFLRLSALGLDKYIAEYGKIRLKEKTKEAIELIPKGV